MIGSWKSHTLGIQNLETVLETVPSLPIFWVTYEGHAPEILYTQS